jgi:hypothetical protein
MTTKRIRFAALSLSIVALAVGFQYRGGNGLVRAGSVLKKCRATFTLRSVFAQSGVYWSANMETGGQDLRCLFRRNALRGRRLSVER